VIPIFGQFTTKLRWLAQDPASQIAQHRHLLPQLAAETHDSGRTAKAPFPPSSGRRSTPQWVRAIHTEVQRRLTTLSLVALGPLARHLAAAVNVRKLPVAEMKATSEPGWQQGREQALDHLGALGHARDQAAAPWGRSPGAGRRWRPPLRHPPLAGHLG